MNKKGLVGIAKFSLIAAILLISTLFIINYVLPSLAEDSTNTTIWTVDENGYPKTDFSPEESVYILGSGFSPTSIVSINVTRPDLNVSSDSSETSENGEFVYEYVLDGIIGDYFVYASTDTIFATTNFTDNPGAIWTTKNDCGDITQDVNQYDVGNHVFINGNGFNIGNYSWYIKGLPGSGDPNIVVASGIVKINSSGAFCFDAYTIQTGDSGVYQVKVGSKGDNYQIGDFCDVITSKTNCQNKYCQWCDQCWQTVRPTKVNEWLTGKCVVPGISCGWHCVTGYCNATCSINSDCPCPSDYCDGTTYVDYPDYGTCKDCTKACYCNVSTKSGQPCHPTLISQDPRCTTPYCGDGSVVPPEECELPETTDNSYCSQTTSECDNHKLGTRDAYGDCDVSCGCLYDSFVYECVQGQCGAECDAQHPCPDTECDPLDGCYGNDYRDYHDVPNNCLGDCLCEENSCTDYTEYQDDPRCIITHAECRDGACVQVEGAGDNLCSINSDCYHKECDYGLQQCVQVNAWPDVPDQCQGNEQCSLCLPDIVVDKQVNPNSFSICQNTTITLNVTGIGCPQTAHFPLDTVLIIDRSGSMGSPATKLADAKIAAKTFINATNELIDRNSLVSFNNIAILNQVLTFNKTAVRNAIDSLTAGGLTAIGAAITTANNHLSSSGRSNATWIEILLTNGNPTVPGDNPIGAANSAKALGITIYTIGLGTDSNATLLTQIANITGGKYYYAPNSSVLQQIYLNISQEVTSIAGKNVVVKDVIPSYANYAGGLSSTPADNCSYSAGTKTITCNLGNVLIGQSYIITFNEQLTTSGNQLTNVHPASNVTFIDYNNTQKTRIFPETYVDVEACDDGVYCNGQEYCSQDTCQQGTPVDCSGLTDECNIGVCDEIDDRCEYNPKPTSTPCQADDSLCTIDHCDASNAGETNPAVCVNYDNVDCSNLNDQCQVGVCDSSDGQCYPDYSNYPLSYPCELDGDLCTNDHCDGSGSCIWESDVDCSNLNDQCQEGICDSYDGQCYPDYTKYPLSTFCEADQDLCTIDHCDGSGDCVWKEDVVVPDPEQCKSFYCDPSDGQIKEDYSNYPLSTSCNEDNDLCTVDHCDGYGSCVWLRDVICPDDTECRDYNICDPQTGQCPYTDEPLSTPCEADEYFCTVDHCDGQGTCVYWKNYNCSDYDLDEVGTCDWIPDDYHFKWDYALGFTSVCDESLDECTEGSYEYTHTCADNDLLDTVSLGGCDAECDENVDCPNTCVAEVWYHGGSCDLGDCYCNYDTYNCNQDDGCYVYETGCEDRDYFCQVEGCDYTLSDQHTDYHDSYEEYCSDSQIREHRTLHDFYCNGVCTDHTSWVDDQLVEDCDQYDDWYDTGKTQWVQLDHCFEKEQKEQEFQDWSCYANAEVYCDYIVNDTQWVDTGKTRSKSTVPVVTNITFEPNPAGGEICIVNITATASDECANITYAEFYFDDKCPGSGTPIYPEDDGSFDNDKKVEYLEKIDADISGLSDGGHNLWMRTQNSGGNWSECVGIPIEIDKYPPVTKNHTIENASWVSNGKYFICGFDGNLTGWICDEPPQSHICEAEFIVDHDVTYGDGYPMFPLDGSWKDFTCEQVYGIINNSEFSEGTHWAKIRGHDCACHWGKVLNFPEIFFIIDTTSPTTTKSVDQPKVECEMTDDGQGNQVEECWYIQQGTQITLDCEDQNPGDGEYSGNPDLGGWVKIKYRIRWKENLEDPWDSWSGWVEDADHAVVTFDKDSYHEIEYYCSDRCGNEEDSHFEIDIVDTQPPVTTKTITGPQIPDSGFTWITQNTKITLSCTDPQPHPVNDVTLYWRYKVDDGSWNENTEEDGYVDIYFGEDSVHTLEWYCVDALGNTETTQVEIDRVDTTPPVTTKTYGTPYYTDGTRKWITSSTSITLDAVDGGAICAVDDVDIYWKNTLVDDNYCENPQTCIPIHTYEGDWILYTGPFYKPEQSCHLIEYWSEDALGNREPIKAQCVFVENTPPVSSKTLGTPKVECSAEDKALYGIDDCWYLTDETSVELSCSDQNPHPVDNVAISYKIEWKENWEDSWQTIKEETVGDYKIFYYEDLPTEYQESFHRLTWYCVDALENEETEHTELDIVDISPPVSQKTMGDPKHACTPEEQALYYPGMPAPTDGCYFINQSTSIEITCSDQLPHPVNDVKIYYKDYLVENQEPAEWTIVDDDHVTITKTEDSAHILKWYCADSLGNSETMHTEYDIVDTQPPTASKEVGTPKIPCQLGQEGDSFFDDVEEGENGWTADGLWHITEYRSYSPTHSWAYNQEEDHTYDTGDTNSGSLISSPIILGTNPQLKFWSWEQTECEGDPECPYDEKEVYVSEDGGLNWNKVWEGQTEEQWYQVTIDLSAYAGKTIKIKFSFDTGDEIDNDYEGWYVDDIKIEDVGSCDYWVRDQVTSITLDCNDETPHPVDHEKMCYRISFDDPAIPWLTDQYCTQYGGTMEGEWCCVHEDNEDLPYTFYFTEDSLHDLEYYCEDELGNKNEVDLEYFKVDSTPPEMSKTIIGPMYGDCPPQSETDVCFIDGVTHITVDAWDPDPTGRGCNVGGVYCEWGYYLDGQWYGWYSNFPINFLEETEHELHIRCWDALENEMVEDVETFYVDKTPPTTTKTYGTPLVEAVTGGYPKWITSNTEITLTVDDTGPHKSGIKETKYRVTLVNDNYCEYEYDCQYATGSGEWNTYTNPFKIQDESCHLIEYYSVDNVDKTEDVKKQCVYVENTAPQIDKTVDIPKHECTQEEWATYGSPDYGCYYINSSSTITLNCSDVMPHPVDQVTLFWRNYLIGETAPQYTEVPGGYAQIQKTQDSEHILEFYCVDALGNSQGTVENPHVEIDIVDNKPPVSQKALGDPKHACTPEEQALYYPGMPAPTDGCYFINQSTSIEITCSDQLPHPVDHVKIYYRDYLFDSTPPTFTEVADDHVTIYKPEDSAHILEWYCVDALGNQETTHVEYDIVDTVPPETTKNIIGPQFYNSTEEKFYIDGATEIELTCSDPDPHPVDHEEIWYRYRVDDGTWNAWTEYTGTIKFPEESKHELEYYCVDALGNEETHHFEIDYVDKNSPVTTKIYGLPRYPDDQYHPTWITSQTPITLTADDNVGICQSGVKAIYWRNTLVDEGYCSGELDCQLAEGSGEFNVYNEPFIKPEQSCHLIEYYSVDNVDKTETVKKQCMYVENTPPVSSKTLGTPKVECSAEDKALYGIDDCWYLTDETSVELSCSDQNPHPVDNVKIYYKIDWKNESGDSWQEGTWIEDSDYVIFTYPEDSYHRLTWYCVDALGNTESTHTELDIVDTQPPVSQKSLDGLHIPCSELPCASQNDCDYYINKDTEIILTCSDQEPHPVNNVKIYYRYFVDDVLHQDWTQYSGSIQYNEDSQHRLEWYCVDALGNTETTQVEVDRVDTTPPETTKAVGDPKWNDGYWVTSQTPITLTTIDKQETCAAGPDTLYYEDWWDSDCDGVVDTLVQSGSVETDSNCELEVTLYLNGECLHELRWYAVDALGNVETEHIQQHKVDDTPPHVLILKPVDGWYSDGEDIPIVAIAEDLDSKTSPCGQDCDLLGKECAVGIADGTQCYAYLLDILPQPMIVELDTEGTFLYNAEAHECQGYATIPEESGIPDGITILIVRAKDNLGNEAGSLAEIIRRVLENCDCYEYDSCAPSCINDVIQDIVTIWNLPKIGIDNNPIDVAITQPEGGVILKGEPFAVSADISDSENGEITSGITTGTPCYITLGGISVGTVPYINEERTCSGIIDIPNDFPQGSQELKVEIADNAGNMGFDIISVRVDTMRPTDIILWKDDEKKDLYYDQIGSYMLHWEGGEDANFDHYELFEEDVSIYSGSDVSKSFSGVVDGTYTYYVISYDAAWSTKSNIIKVIVDTVDPTIEITGTSGFLGIWTLTYAVNDALPSSGIDKIIVSDSNTPFVTCFDGWCMVIGGNYVELTVYDNAGNSGSANTEGAPADKTAPQLLTTSPSGVITYNEITLSSTTDEPSICKYGTDDDYSVMAEMTGSGTTSHSADLGTLTDGLKVYHIKCEDIAGNLMEQSKTIVFYIDTTGSFELAIPDYGHYWSEGWNTFWLPQLILDDICGEGPYPVEDIVKSLYENETANFNIIWYFDGTEWLFFVPQYPGSSTLQYFNDQSSLPYYIFMNKEDRLEITLENCPMPE